MQNIIAIFANILIFAGTCLLVASLFSVRRLVSQLPAGGSLQQKWNGLSVLILFFIFGYISYLAVYWDRSSEDVDLIVPKIVLSTFGI